MNPALGVADPASLDASPLVTMIPVALLRTSLERLRSVQPQRSPSQPQLRDLPIRVVADDVGFFEIVDGFKRFAFWRDEGERIDQSLLFANLFLALLDCLCFTGRDFVGNFFALVFVQIRKRE